jgi:hypothetical protein
MNDSEKMSPGFFNFQTDYESGQNESVRESNDSDQSNEDENYDFFEQSQIIRNIPERTNLNLVESPVKMEIFEEHDEIVIKHEPIDSHEEIIGKKK